MTNSEGWQRRRAGKALRCSAVALLLLAAGCGSTSTGGDPSISAKEDRNSGGALEAITVTGKRFTPNGTVRITTLLAGSATNASPYVEEDIQADGDGEIRYERRPLPCPQPADYGRGSWTSVVARDMTSGISGSAQLDPGGEPDCRA